MVFGPQVNKQSLLSLGPGVVLSIFAFLAPLYWVRSAASTRFATVNDSLIAIQTKLAALNLVASEAWQHFGIFEDWRNFGNPRKIGKFLEYVLTEYHLNKQNWL